MNKYEVMSLFVDDVASRRGAIHDFITNQKNSFEDRREVWLTTPTHLMTNNAWILHLPEYESKYGEISWFDEFYMDRRQDVDLRQCVEILRDSEASEEQVEDFIVACVNKGFHGFNLDW